ncbi:electron transfer flavoprotein beta subunit lysine methyltransferase-like [Anopheles aquasalis]|uniref:electron transfer flavoprotein beta subunit lysine methyltransferase-like n=1 Tax=Anopheles aquasalis TaxID=42839 RepID=UPI00215A673A|nr:electron transfer flavoprotein beta subunit lysine methyltransferase-like [Anopheles aquasalis]XP_050090361.1 electron transfer flavoprotein beta subunit lysine methyltransferase-like [Anopheles aquasalis]XP_050090362.1 electron transfer flavoprotein beta subunit lysine methyltransferase-like [Anopheles aquasalis]
MKMFCVRKNMRNGIIAIIANQGNVRIFQTMTEDIMKYPCKAYTIDSRLPRTCVSNSMEKWNQKENQFCDVRSKILSNTVVSRHHMTPEIALHLITPECAIYHQPIGPDFPFNNDPFWGFFWPGGQALTRFILDYKDRFRGKSILDLGCGCGASTVAALQVQASHVIANDIDPDALQATLLNVEINGVMNGRMLSLNDSNFVGRDSGVIDCDVILIGDMFYDKDIAADLHPWMQRLARHGKEIFVGDPGRHGITETGVLREMEHMVQYKLPNNVCLENNGFSHVNVWQFWVNQ